MEVKPAISSQTPSLCTLLILALYFLVASPSNADLSFDFYAASCLNEGCFSYGCNNPGKLLHLLFLDCLVEEKWEGIFYHKCQTKRCYNGWMRLYHRIGSSQGDSKRKLTLIDTTQDGNYADHLIKKCPADPSKSKTVINDPESSSVFNNQYCRNLLVHKGLFQSDSVLLEDVRTGKQVEAFANDQTISSRVGGNRL